jgi:hypothetical protein
MNEQFMTINEKNFDISRITETDILSGGQEVSPPT